MTSEGLQNFHRKHVKCPGCNKKRLIKYGAAGFLCTGCHSARNQSVNSGNLDIDNLIKDTHRNNIQFRLEWIPFKDFRKVQKITEGGFSTIFTATWIKGRVTSYSGEKLCRKGPMKVVLKVLKDSQNITSTFIKEVKFFFAVNS
ncbi:10883_t:CDS:1 [Acaulospora morrowiae]|uniref:10883_t:CDS:1 n=1 Tax=Acaulospora morrowiae TaxID=94023 RepID=A0A9N8V9G5_9GLOM|nr:10883_t:CDS:1 [Acaulospora morrowiae]